MMVWIDSVAWATQMMTCFYMTGVILIIQLIHYPSFVLIDRAKFGSFHLQHTSALGLIAAPAMCGELASAFWIAKGSNWIMILNCAAVLLLWFITFFVSVPAHNRLAAGFDENAWGRLTKTNWLRTGLWVIRSGFLLTLLISDLMVSASKTVAT